MRPVGRISFPLQYCNHDETVWSQLKNVRLPELLVGAEQQALLSFADELLEHCRNRGVHIDLPLRYIALQVRVYLAPPRFLIDLGGGAVVEMFLMSIPMANRKLRGVRLVWRDVQEMETIQRECVDRFDAE